MLAIILALQAAPALVPGHENLGEPKAPFEFRDYRANMQKPRDLSCFRPQSRPDQLLCSDPVDTVSDIKVDRSLITFDETGLASLSITVPKYEGANFLSALRKKYGKTCSEEEGEVQNGMGVKFKRVSVSWCFLDGQAIFYSPGQHMDEATFFFSATRTKLPKDPKVDF